MRDTISLTNLAGIIRGLCATDTSPPNHEYERACAEVFTEAAGLSMDHKETVAAALGLRIVNDDEGCGHCGSMERDASGELAHYRDCQDA